MCGKRGKVRTICSDAPCGCQVRCSDRLLWVSGLALGAGNDGANQHIHAEIAASEICNAHSSVLLQQTSEAPVDTITVTTAVPVVTFISAPSLPATYNNTTLCNNMQEYQPMRNMVARAQKKLTSASARSCFSNRQYAIVEQRSCACSYF